MQVMNRPYMSTGEVDLVNEHLDLMCRRSVEDKKLQFYNDIKAVILAAKRIDTAEKRKMQTIRYGVTDAASATGKKKEEIELRKEQKILERTRAERARLYFVNYNTVESTLVASAILICLCGIMFESGELDQAGYENQRDTLSFFVIFVIIASFVYYIAVFFAEMTKTTKTNICIRFFLRRSRPDDLQYDPDRDATIKLGVNPFHAERASAADESHRVRTATLEQALNKAEEEKAKLQEELTRARTQSQNSPVRENTSVSARPSIDGLDQADEGILKAATRGTLESESPSVMGRLAGSLYARPSAAAKHKEKAKAVKNHVELETTSVDMKTLMAGKGGDVAKVGDQSQGNT